MIMQYLFLLPYGIHEALRQLLVRLHGHARPCLPSVGRNDPIFDFGTRLERSSTLAQLALRTVELSAAVFASHAADGSRSLSAELPARIAPGVQLQVHVEQDGALAWSPATVVALGHAPRRSGASRS